MVERDRETKMWKQAVINEKRVHQKLCMSWCWLSVCVSVFKGFTREREGRLKQIYSDDLQKIADEASLDRTVPAPAPAPAPGPAPGPPDPSPLEQHGEHLFTKPGGFVLLDSFQQRHCELAWIREDHSPQHFNTQPRACTKK